MIPLTPGGTHAAALVLCRDVTELRRRERELVGKDVTIREIHHRVKNNLQTVAALLRLQARRLEDGPARAALEEAQRRVGSIALVHETLSQTMHDSVDFDEIADRIAEMVGGADDAERPVTVTRTGSFGPVPAGGGHPDGAGARRAAPERRRARVGGRGRRRRPARLPQRSGPHGHGR